MMPSKKDVDPKKLIEAVESGKPSEEIMKAFGIETSAELKQLYFEALVPPSNRLEPRTRTIFISAALFTYAEKEFNRQLRDILVAAGHDVILPQEFEEKKHQVDLFHECVDGVEEADLVIAVVDGAEVDAGVGFEMGVAYARGIPVIALRTDFRRRAETFDGCLNLMLHCGATKIIHSSDNPFQTVVSAVQEILEEIE